MTVSLAASLTGQHCIVYHAHQKTFLHVHVHKTSIQTGNVFVCPSNSTSNLPKKPSRTTREKQQDLIRLKNMKLL